MVNLSGIELINRDPVSPERPSSFRIPTLYYRCHNNTDWTMNAVTGNCEEIIDAQADALITNSISFGKMILPDEEPYILNTVQNALIKKVPYQLMYHIKTSKNNKKLLFEHGQGVYDASENVSELIGFISDITLSVNHLIHIPAKFSMADCINEVIQLAYCLKLTNNKKTVITSREAEIAVYYCQGFSMKEIGIKLNISNRTAESHLNKIKSKLGCHNKSQLRSLFINTRAGKNLILKSI